jgi:ribosomal protein L32
MPREHWVIVASIVREKPFLYLGEIAAAVDRQCGERYARNIISKELRRHSYSRKEMRRLARQRSNYKRYLYHKEVGEYMEDPSQLCLKDEVGKNGRGSQRRRGWGPKGEDIVITEYLNRGKNISV